MNSTKQSGFLGFLKAVFAGFGTEMSGERQVANERSSERNVAAVKKASACRNDRKRTVRYANVRKHAFNPVKPSYETLSKGTVVLIDGANLLHEFEPSEAPKVLRSVVVERPQPVRTFSNDVKGGFCGYGNVLLAKGNVQGAIRCFEKGVACHQSEGYAGLAEICHSQGDVKTAAKFARLGEKLQRRLRDQELRKRRLWAERRRACCNRYALCA